MIPRTVEKAIKNLSKGYPIISITGPRQSGKTTLAKHIFSNLPYISFENPDLRESALSDPRSFLKRYLKGAIFDEVQRAPLLFSYLQEIVDSDKKMGRFVFTGSAQFGLLTGITQSLAGRVGIIHLLPFTRNELYPNKNKIKKIDLSDIIYTGFYPPIHDRKLHPPTWHANYIQTYIERDVRQLINVKDLRDFQSFLRLCAGRTGQLLNLSNIASDCGITHNTARAWISILEASYIVFLLKPHYKNFNKRIIKTPKLYFYDTGLLCYLLSMQNREQFLTHSLKGNIFESYIISEYIKSCFNEGLLPNFYFWRDRTGNEVDLIIEHGEKLQPIEIKSGETVNKDFLKNLKKWKELAGNLTINPELIYGGDSSYVQSHIKITSWKDI